MFPYIFSYLHCLKVILLLPVNCLFFLVHVKIFNDGEQEFEANGEFMNALWTIGMCANLQVVQMIGINWRPNEMSFIELILSKARLLHTFFISHSEDIVMSNEDALNELLRYRRASAEAQVLFEGRET